MLTPSELRVNAGYETQQQLATEMKVSRVAVTQWERGVASPRSSKIPKLAKLLGVSEGAVLASYEAVKERNCSNAQ